MSAPSPNIPLREVKHLDTEASLYEVRQKIYPRAVQGKFAAWRWSVVWLTQILFYGTAWLSWNGRQAVLFDLVARKFYIFGFVFWPQDFIYLAALLVAAALSLFLFTAIAGRLWCGYACPQTVYTEIFLWIERKIEGERAARMKLDLSGLTRRKFALKTIKHSLWIALSLWTGFTFVGYFSPIKTLAVDVAYFNLGPWETFWILFYGFATYGNAGWMREQVCKYMCPYARFQGAMFDADTLIITYDRKRGEMRGARPKNKEAKAHRLGDCVDCHICVQVCPTGIDIRNGLQYECIGCAACIDACDQVMDKMQYPRGLIRYSTENALKHGPIKNKGINPIFRPRVLIYSAILSALILLIIALVLTRIPLKVDVIRDRNNLGRETPEGRIENIYRLQIMNLDEQAHRYVIKVKGLPDITMKTADADQTVAAATVLTLPLSVQVAPGELTPGSHRIEFEINTIDQPSWKREEKSSFIVR